MDPKQMLSDPEIAVQLENVAVKYHLWHAGQPTLGNLLRKRKGPREFWALQDISCTVRRGETVGLVGANGAGKSTLLRVMARILPPQTGRVVICGNISPLLELSSGIEPDLTGRENIFLKAAMLGRSRSEIKAQLERIIEFAGLREFIDQPFRTYSSGMMARLGFAIATDIEPDILLIDEVLAVGDAEFSIRSRDRITELRKHGSTVVVASHNSGALRGMCDRVIWLAHGRIQMFGPAASVLSAYERAGVDLQDLDAHDESEPSGVYHLHSDDLLYALEFPHATFPEIQAAEQAPFDPPHISPARNLSEHPEGAPRFLAKFRFVRGTYFYEQIARLMLRAPVTLTVLREPMARGQASSEQEYTANAYTRWFGVRAPVDAKIPEDAMYRNVPLTRVDYNRARDVLASIAFVGIYEKPLETLLLFWHTFGWEPAPVLPVFPTPAPALLGDLPARIETLIRGVNEYPVAGRGVGELQGTNEWDIALYALACELFEQRYAEMVRVLGVDSHDPAAVHFALRERFTHRSAQNGHSHSMRWRMDRALPGRGWYNVEYNGEYGAYRWTGPEPRTFIRLPLPAALREEDAELCCNLIFGNSSPALTQLALRANDTALEFKKQDAPDGSLNITTRVPRRLLRDQPFLNLVLEVRQTFTPQSGTWRDSRKLGVAVRWIELRVLA